MSNSYFDDTRQIESDFDSSHSHQSVVSSDDKDLPELKQNDIQLIG